MLGRNWCSVQALDQSQNKHGNATLGVWVNHPRTEGAVHPGPRAYVSGLQGVACIHATLECSEVFKVWDGISGPVLPSQDFFTTQDKVRKEESPGHLRPLLDFNIKLILPTFFFPLADQVRLFKNKRGLDFWDCESILSKCWLTWQEWLFPMMPEGFMLTPSLCAALPATDSRTSLVFNNHSPSIWSLEILHGGT